MVFEYHVIDVFAETAAELESQLDELGQLRWELTSVEKRIMTDSVVIEDRLTSVESAGYRLILKRKK